MIPNSDFTKIIFRRDQFSSKFKMTDFNEGYTRGVITREEAQEVLNTVNNIPHTIPMEAGKYIKPAAIITCILVAITVLICLIYGVFAAVAPGIVFGEVALVLTGMCCFMCCFLGFSTASMVPIVLAGVIIMLHHQKVQQKTQVTLGMYNQRFQDRDIVWIIGERGHWLQLNLNFNRNQPPPIAGVQNGGYNQAPMNNWAGQGQNNSNQITPLNAHF